MQIDRWVLALGLALSLGLGILGDAAAQAEARETESARPPTTEVSAAGPAFRLATAEDRKANSTAILIGPYAITSDAAIRLSEVYTLELTLNELRHFDWNTRRWDKQNAELTVRQRLDDYLQTADDFYSGRGKRGTGVTARRMEKYTDAELGDRQLSSALMTVVMAAMWQVPFQEGQAERLDDVLKQRLERIEAKKAGQ